MIKLYVLEGPAGCGNSFGFFHAGLVPAGKFAVVTDGEYANGGHGPSTADGKLYRTREAAEEGLRRWESTPVAEPSPEHPGRAEAVRPRQVNR